METYEYPLGVTFRACSTYRAAVRVLGGATRDYSCTVKESGTGRFVEVSSASTGEWLTDIPMR